jgi:SAM-dependent methyltransferase
MFVSFRRHNLDSMLSATDFHGDILDVGGKKENGKGLFQPPRCRSWRYVNIDPATKPDYLASADALPLPDSSTDCVLLAETLEHLEHPEKALAEALRVLRPEGGIVLTMPFLYPVHGDPRDFQRWAPEKFRRELEALGFSEIRVRPMGGLIAVAGDSLEAFCQAHYGEKRKPPLLFRALRWLMRGPLQAHLLRWDAKLPFQDAITSGYFVTARKAR